MIAGSSLFFKKFICGFSLLFSLPREGKSPGNEVGVACGLCVNELADATLSSEDEEIENPIETAGSRGALLHLLSNFLSLAT